MTVLLAFRKGIYRKIFGGKSKLRKQVTGGQSENDLTTLCSFRSRVQIQYKVCHGHCIWKCKSAFLDFKNTCKKYKHQELNWLVNALY